MFVIAILQTIRMELDCFTLGSSAALGLSLLSNWISLGSVNWATKSIHDGHIGLWIECASYMGFEICLGTISSRAGMYKILLILKSSCWTSNKRQYSLPNVMLSYEWSCSFFNSYHYF